MSTDYDLLCLTCDVEHNGLNDANHQDDMCKEIILLADGLHELGKVYRLHKLDLHNLVGGRGGRRLLKVDVSYGALDLEWFAVHGKHDLAVMSEYGEVVDTCGEDCDVPSREQWRKEKCRLPQGHEGVHWPTHPLQRNIHPAFHPSLRPGGFPFVAASRVSPPPEISLYLLREVRKLEKTLLQSTGYSE